MKCPECQSNFSELRDVCPGCALDLRDYKTERGFPVSFEDLTYEELLKKFPRTKQFDAVLAEKEQDLFLLAFKEAANLKLTELSLGTGSLGRQVNREEISLLFDVLDDTLAETARYVDEVQTSENVFVESETLQFELDKLEKMAEAPLFSLKGTAAGIATPQKIPSDGARVQSKVALKPVFLGRSLRVISVCIDTIVVFAIAFFLAYFISKSNTRDVYSVILSEQIILYADLFVLGASLIIPVAIVYLLVMGLLYRRTCGLFFVGGKVCSEEGKAPPQSAIIIRSLLAPVSAILTAFIPLFMGIRGFHEKVAKTDILIKV